MMYVEGVDRQVNCVRRTRGGSKSLWRWDQHRRNSNVGFYVAVERDCVLPSSRTDICIVPNGFDITIPTFERTTLLDAHLSFLIFVYKCQPIRPHHSTCRTFEQADDDDDNK